MPEITKPTSREIIESFAEEIEQRKTPTATPSRIVINFRNDKPASFERDVFRVPIELLRFRKDNGRIASDVIDYEKTCGVLDERNDDAQNKIRKFLERKDPGQTNDLTKSIQHAGQESPAIITCDGFLIDGNRRKMVIAKLAKLDPEKFGTMEVVILPSGKKAGDGGKPTLLEIEKLENRYQLQSDGKSEYSHFDRALSIKRKIDVGLSLEDQITDDPLYANALEKDKTKAIKELYNKYLRPLECIDRYLRQFGREGQYSTISTSQYDPKGRWYAFLDYSLKYHSTFKKDGWLIENDINENEIGTLETAAFNIIRLRIIPSMKKVHSIMRDFPKYCSNTKARKEILEISKKVKPKLPKEECYQDGKQLSPQDIDAKWDSKNKKTISYHLHRAVNYYENKQEKETPINLLQAALNKLLHENMDLSTITHDDYGKARDLIVKIKEKSIAFEKQLYDQQKKLKKLKNPPQNKSQKSKNPPQKKK